MWKKVTILNINYFLFVRSNGEVSRVWTNNTSWTANDFNRQFPALFSALVSKVKDHDTPKRPVA